MPQGASIEVDEPLVHDGGSLGQMGSQTDAIGVTDAHPGGNDEVDHARELVDEQDGEGGMGDARLHSCLLQIGHPDRADGRPRVVGQHTEDAVEVDGAGLSHAR